MKTAIIDVGELGWSLYASAHVNWLNDKNAENTVITLPDRKCFYPNTTVVNAPDEFVNRYGKHSQDGFGLYGVSNIELRKFFATFIPPGFSIPSYFGFSSRRLNDNILSYKAYEYKDLSKGHKKIIVFPRCRNTFYPREKLKNIHPAHYEKRNLSKKFYADLCSTLCTEFPTVPVYSIGVPSGAYKLEDSVPHSNFVDLVGKTSSIQEVIDMCNGAVLSIGGTSAPPKIAMMQGVPSIIIGHEKKRFMVEENWMDSPVCFYEIDLSKYGTITMDMCTDTILRFARRHIT